MSRIDVDLPVVVRYRAVDHLWPRKHGHDHCRHPRVGERS
jgi:hypothetical protein